MESSSSETTVTTTNSSRSSPSPPPPATPLPQVTVVSPCAACKILRRRCVVEKCVLAPYFPPNDPLKFITAHRVFGASNIIKLLQELAEPQRADAVSSLVYEAHARLRDPVYGSAGAICNLQKQVNELQAQLAMAQAELLNMHCQHANLMAMHIYYTEENTADKSAPQQQHDSDYIATTILDSPNAFLNDNSFVGSFWDQLPLSSLDVMSV